MRSLPLAAILLTPWAPLAGCEIHIAGDDLAGPIEIRWAATAPWDERDFDSPWRHFGQVAPFTDRPVFRCRRRRASLPP